MLCRVAVLVWILVPGAASGAGGPPAIPGAELLVALGAAYAAIPAEVERGIRGFPAEEHRGTVEAGDLGLSLGLVAPETGALLGGRPFGRLGLWRTASGGAETLFKFKPPPALSIISGIFVGPFETERLRLAILDTTSLSLGLEYAAGLGSHRVRVRPALGLSVARLRSESESRSQRLSVTSLLAGVEAALPLRRLERGTLELLLGATASYGVAGEDRSIRTRPRDIERVPVPRISRARLQLDFGYRAYVGLELRHALFP